MLTPQASAPVGIGTTGEPFIPVISCYSKQTLALHMDMILSCFFSTKVSSDESVKAENYKAKYEPA